MVKKTIERLACKKNFKAKAMTPAITTALQLDKYIAELENKKQLLQLELKATVKEKLEGLKPANLIKTVWNEVSSSPEIKHNILDNSLGLAAGFVSRKILIGKSHNPVRRLLGSLAQYGITNVVANNSNPIKNAGLSLLKLIFKKKNKKQDAVVME